SKYVLREKFLAQVFDHNLARSGFVRLFDDGIEIIALADVADERDDVIGIVLLQPGNDDGSIQPAGIGKHDFFRHGRSSTPDSLPRRAVTTRWLSVHADGSRLDRIRRSESSPSRHR